MQTLAEEVAAHREFQKVYTEAERRQEEMEDVHVQLVSELENQLGMKEDAMIEIQYAVDEMRLDMEEAYDVNGQFKSRMEDMERNLKKHLTHIERTEAHLDSGDKAAGALGNRLLSCFASAHKICPMNMTMTHLSKSTFLKLSQEVVLVLIARSQPL